MRLDWSAARKALAIALPLIIADASLSVIWVVDAFFVSKLGYLELAGVGAAGYLLWFAMVISSLVYMGAFVLAGQAIGSGDKALASRVIGESLTASTLLGLVVAGGVYAAMGPASARLAGEAAPYMAEYLRASLPAIPLHYAQLIYDAAFRAFGKTKPIMASVVASSIVNIVLDPILIFGLGPLPSLGVRGAAYASVAASATATLILALAALSLPGRPKPLPPGRLAVMASRLGFPSMVERVLFVGGNLAYLAAVASCGEEALAAHTIGVRVESLAFMPLFSLATAAGAMVSWEVGSGRIEKSRILAWELLKLSALAGAVLGALLAVASPLIASYFSEDPTITSLATVYLVIAAATEPMLAVAITSAQIIRSAGDTRTPTLINSLGLYAFRVAPAHALTALAPSGLCAVAAWLAMALDVTARAAILAFVQHRYYTKLARKLV